MSRMRNNPIRGALYFVRGFGLIIRPGVRRYVVIPLGVNIAVFTALIYFGAGQLQAVLDRMLPAWLDWLQWLLLPLFLVASLVIAFFAFNMVANLVCAPFNGLLAEAVERELTGRDPAGGGGFAKLVAELAATMTSEVRKFVYIAVRAVPLLILMLVPGVNVLASFAWLVLGAWMLAVSFADYPMANHGLDFAEQRRRLGSKRYLSLGFGGCIMGALAVPVLNFLVIPCAVAGATAMWVDDLADAPPPQARVEGG